MIEQLSVWVIMSGGRGYYSSPDWFRDSPRDYSIFRSREAAEKKLRENLRNANYHLERATADSSPYISSHRECVDLWENAEVIQVVD